VRVLHLIDSLIQAGAEALLKDMVPRMRARGVEVSVAVLKELDSPFERELRERGTPFLPTAAGGIYSPLHVLSLQRQIQEFDLVHTYLFPAQLFVPIARILARRNVPLLLSEGAMHHGRKHWWFRPVENWMYRRYTAIACASEAVAAGLRVWVPAVREKIVVVQNGIDLHIFENALPLPRPSVGINNSNCVLLYVARFNQQKDHTNLLRAMTQIPDAHLLLVGDGELRPHAERLARSLGIAGRVHFLGRRKDVPKLLKMADIYVHAPAFEGFGIAAAEAMAAGKPIVATNVPGLAQVIGDAGILVPPSDPEALATQVTALMKSRARQKQLGERAAQRARTFSIDNTVSAYIELYRALSLDGFPDS
jgi:glycosyltransferase involved in cell wall biosynthesis